LNALELRQQVTSQGDDNMTTNSQQPAEPVIVEPGTAATVENPVRLKGTGVPDAIVEVRTEDKLLLLKVRVWSDGTWSGNASENLPEGRNTISAVQTNNYGPSPASRSRSFVVEWPERLRSFASPLSLGGSVGFFFARPGRWVPPCANTPKRVIRYRLSYAATRSFRHPII